MKRRDPPFDAFQPGHLPPYTVASVMRDGYTREEAEAAVRNREQSTVWVNSRYQVIRYPIPAHGDWPAMWWLSIKRNDRRPIHDWRDLQRIKNALVGPEHEGMELYPAESRLNDEANQYHLWVLADPTKRFPLGHTIRHVATPEEAAKNGAVQRPFDEEAQ